MKKQLLALLVAIGAGASAHAQQPFTITVPVRISNLPPEFRTYTVRCVVLSSAGVGTIGTGSFGGSIEGGAVTVDAPIGINLATRETDPSLATNYFCAIEFMGPGGLTYRPSEPSPAGIPPVPWDKSRPFRPRVEGAVPR